MTKVNSEILHHGGNLETASALFSIPPDQWLDLSTGINPNGFPLLDAPREVWQRLPNNNQQLLESAARYYRCEADCVLPIPGSQFAIQRLPQLFQTSRVALPKLGYKEHQRAWGQGQHSLFFYDDDALDKLEQDIFNKKFDIVVVINPNNPSCRLIDKQRLLRWHNALIAHGGYLIIDEAFIDTQPEHSLTTFTDRPGLIILRSFGKFFGLAGLRLGFLIAQPKFCQKLIPALGPWPINGPAQWLGQKALEDSTWQARVSNRLKKDSIKFSHCIFDILSQPFPNLDVRRTDFFISILLPINIAGAIYQHMGDNGILLRYIPIDEKSACLRCGLPGVDDNWQRFQRSLLQFVELVNVLPKNSLLDLNENHLVYSEHATISASI